MEQNSKPVTTRPKRARWRAVPAWAWAWGLAILFAVAAFRIPEPAHRLEYIRIENRLGIPIWLVLYQPQPQLSPQAPGAVVCQPINDPPEYARTLALELVQEGFVVVSLDWRGRAAKENRQLLRARTQETLRADVTSAVAYLRAFPGVDPERIVVAGHSVGGTLAVDAALADPGIRAVAAIGMDADVTPQEAHNVLWVVGLYDEFRSLGRMRQVFRASAGTPAEDETTVGDFRAGTARRLGVSPTADHFNELQDWNIHREVLAWFERAVGLPADSRPLGMEERSLLLMLAMLSALAGALLASRRMAQASANPHLIQRTAALTVLAAMVLLSRVRGPQFLLAANGIIVLLVFALLGGFVGALDDDALRRGVRMAWRVALVLWVSVVLTLVANNFAYYFESPRYLAWLPIFAPKHPLDLVAAYVFDYPRPLLFSVYDPQSIRTRLWVYALAGMEIVSPGLLLGLVERLIRRRPLEGERARRPIASVVVLLALAVFLAAVLWLRFEQGFLTTESARTGLRFLVRFAVLPFFFFALLWKWASKGKNQARLGAGRESARN